MGCGCILSKISLTGYGKESDRRRSQEAGFDHLLVKPAKFEKVQEILASVPEKANSTLTERVPSSTV